MSELLVITFPARETAGQAAERLKQRPGRPRRRHHRHGRRREGRRRHASTSITASTRPRSAARSAVASWACCSASCSSRSRVSPSEPRSGAFIGRSLRPERRQEAVEDVDGGPDRRTPLPSSSSCPGNCGSARRRARSRTPARSTRRRSTRRRSRRSGGPREGGLTGASPTTFVGAAVGRLRSDPADRRTARHSSPMSSFQISG